MGSSRLEEPEGLRTPRAMVPVDVHGGGEAEGEDELGRLALQALSLTETTTSSGEREERENTPSPDVDGHATQVEIEEPSASGSGSGSANVPARNIPTPSANGDGTRRYELTPGPLNAENVMTPRNDVGPFVLDGGANRDSTGGGPRSLDAAAAAPATHPPP